MTALIERLQSGSGPDRELDALVWCAFWPEWTPYDHPDGHVFKITSDKPKRRWPKVTPKYTADPLGVGHCLALMAEALPGWKSAGMSQCRIEDDTTIDFDGEWGVLLTDGSWPVFKRRDVDGEHAELPRAILIALLRAQEAQN